MVASMKVRGHAIALLMVLGGLMGPAPTAPAAAQVLSGVITSDVDGSPLQGAVVELLDTSGDEVAARLTGPDGTFSFRGTAPGRYGFRVGLLGYRTITTAPFELAPGQNLHRRVAIPLEPIRLDEIRASREGRCGGNFAGTDLVRLWEEARKGLMAVILTESSPLVSFRTAIYDRDLDPDWGGVLREQVRTRRTWGNDPFRSAPAAELLARGFVRGEAGDTVTYYGPDAQLLLSEPFLQQYCFGITRRRGGEVGLTFEPEARLRHTAQIEGTLWLDGETAGLERLEFTHTRSPVREFESGGWAVYERLPTGAWIIREWRLRMPRPAIIDGLPTSRLASIHETAGEVVEVLGLDRAMRLENPPGAVRGRVAAEGTGEPLGNVLVYLEGTDHADTTDIDGRYRMADIRPGRYRVSWAHHQLRTASGPPPPQPLEVVSGRDAVVDFEVPLPPVLAAGCPDRTGAAVWGRVVDDATGVPLSGVEVSLAPELPGDEVADPALRHTDARGTFRFCGLQSGAFTVSVAPTHASAASERARVEPDAAPEVELRVTMTGPEDAPARIVGRVLDAATDTGMAGVTIRVDGRTRAISDENGAFLVDDLLAGPHTILARSLGYGDAEGEVRTGASQTLNVEIRLGYEPIALDPIVVTASRTRLGGSGRLSDFTYRMERGWGTYVVAEEIERRNPTRLIHVIRETGFRTLGSTGGGWRVATLINPRYNCAPMVYLDGVPITRANDRESIAAAQEAAAAIEMIHPLEVAGIEIYKGVGEVPAAFGGSAARCGVIAIWTRGFGGGPGRDEGGP